MIHDVKVYDGKGKLIRTNTDKAMKKRFWDSFTKGLDGLKATAKRRIVVRREKQRIHEELYERGPGQTLNQEAGNHGEN